MGIRAGNQRKYFEFALWAIALGRPPSIKEVEGFFQVDRQSAWRTHRNWMLANEHHRIHQAGGKRPVKPASNRQENPTYE